VFIDIWLDFDSDGDADADDYPGYLQAEPYYTVGAAPLDTWTQIDAMSLMWSTYVGPDYPYEAPTIYDFQANAYGPSDPHGTVMADWTDGVDFGPLSVLRIDVRVGYGSTWENFTGYADDIVINGYNQGFEPIGEVWVDDDFTTATTGWGYDHFDNIQRGIDTVYAGGTVNVAAGTYTENIVIDNRLTLDGAGSGDNPAVDTIITSAAGNTDVIGLNTGGTSASDRMVIRDLRVTGATGGGNAGNGIEIRAGSYLTFDNLSVVGNGGNGIATDPGGVMFDVALNNCTVSNNGGVGFRLASGTTLDGLTITGCNIDNNSIAGSEMYGPVTGININGGTFTGNGSGNWDQSGIYANQINVGFASPKPNVIQNVDLSNQPRGIFFWYKGDSKLTIDGVTADNNGLTDEYGGISILVQDTTLSEIEISDTTVTNGADVYCGAILIQAFGAAATINNVIIDNVEVRGNGSAGIYLRATTGSITGGSITNSHIENNNTGIYLYYNVSNVFISGNDILNNVTAGIVIADGAAAGNEAHNNNIVGNGIGVENQDTVDDFDATLNWWGDATGPYHATANAGGTGNPVSDNVLFDPWVGDPGESDSDYFGPGESGTLNVDSTSVDVQMDGAGGSFGVTELPGTPGGGFTGMGGGQGIGKTIVINTTATDGTYVAVIQMYYGDVDLTVPDPDIIEDDLRLYYYNTATPTWELAVDGNTTGTPQWMGDMPAPAAIPANLGQYGIDTTAKVIWAVVDHNTDYSGGVGPLVVWVDDDYTTLTPGWHLTHFDNIQDAIDSCASGAVIHVAEGMYAENPDINKANLTITADGAVANTVIQPGAGVGIGIQTGGDGLTLDGFKIISGAGTTFLVELTHHTTGVTITGNTINTTGTATMGISVGAAGATGLSVTGNEFTGDAGDGLVWGPNIVDVTVTGNTFTGASAVAYGVQFAGVTGTSEISGNTFTDIVGSGAIVISNGKGTAGLTITGNEITGCANGIRFADYAPYAPAGNMDDVDITDNTLTGNDNAIRVGNGAHVIAHEFFIEYNYISGSTTYGLQNEHATEIVTAMKNWWGHNTGPTHESNPLGLGDAITDKVIYQPWLDNADQPDDSDDGYIDAYNDARTRVWIHDTTGLDYVVSAGRWSHNPDHAYPDFMVVGGYFIDVVVEDHTDFDADTWIEIRFYYDDEDVDAGLIEQTFRMKWWDGSDWLDCSETGVNMAGNYVWVIVRASGTSPTLADMYGTPFAASGQRVVIPGLTFWGSLALAGLFLGAIVWMARRKRAAVSCRD